MSDKVNVYESVTNAIISAIEANPGSWTMPWHTELAIDMPKNVMTGKRYRGVNVLSLWGAAHQKGYTSPIWGTYKQWSGKGAQVRKGEKASLVVFWKQFETMQQTEGGELKKVRRMFARLSYAFNVSQVEGYEMPAPREPSVIDRHEAAEAVIKATGATIKEGGSAQAFYVPSMDYIQLPLRGDFVGSKTSTAQEAFYSTAFHELTHWTGHKDRLDRQLTTRFNTEAYAAEELIAELGAAFLCAHVGISQSPRLDHAQYINNWLRILKGDNKAIFTAASQAEKAMSFILGESKEEAASEAAQAE